MSQYNDIKITPNIGVSSDPKIEFIGAGNSTITLKVLDTADGGITFEGQKAELLSLVDADVSFGSSVASFSVNDFYGVPQIQAYNDGRVLVAPYGAQTVGIGTTNPQEKVDIVGNLKVTGNSTFSGIVTTATDLYVSGNTFLTGNIGIGTTSTLAKVNVIGDVKVGVDTSQGLILTSPNGTTFRLVVDNSGNLSAISTTL